MTEQQPAHIFVVSGGVGSSGEQLVNTVLAQFPDSDVPLTIINHVRGVGQVETAVTQAKEQDAIIVHTMVDAHLRETLIALARLRGVVAIDLMGPLLTELSAALGEEPLGKAGRYRQTRRSYFERVEAMEYTMNHDDGKRPEGWSEADVVLVGVSRSGKTPLSIYLSVLGWKVANMPIVPGVPPPRELFKLDADRVIGLTIDVDRLLNYRRRRTRLMGVSAKGAYADPEHLIEEVEAARLLFRRGGFFVINVTDKTVEASADEIIKRLKRVSQLTSKADDPKA